MVRHAGRETTAIKEEVYTHRSLDVRDTWGSTRMWGRGRGGGSVARTFISILTGRDGQGEVGMLSNLRTGEFE